MPPRDCCQRQHMPGRFSQVFCPPLHAILNALRNRNLARSTSIPETCSVENIARRDQSSQRLFNEKGIALGQCEEGIQELPVQETTHIKGRMFRIENNCQHRIDFDACKRQESNFLREPRPIHLGKPVAQGWRYFVMTIGSNKQDRLGQSMPCERMQKIQAGIIAPMHIFYNKEYWRPR